MFVPSLSWQIFPMSAVPSLSWQTFGGSKSHTIERHHRKKTKRRPCLSAPRAIIPSGSSLRDSRNLRKRHSFFSTFLVCLSRACLDKMMRVLYEKWSDEKEFLRNQSDQSSRSSKRTLYLYRHLYGVCKQLNGLFHELPSPI